MAGSRLPFPWTDGQPQSLRGDLFAKLHLAARVGAQVGVASAQANALARGQSVTFTAAQLQSFCPLSTEHPSLPADLGAASSWVLTNDDTLTAA